MLRSRWVACCLALTVPVVVSTAVAAAPGGPRLAVLKLPHDRTKAEIATLGPSGGAYRRVLPASPKARRKLGMLSIPAWSPDGTQMAFSQGREKHWWISLAPADGGRPRPIPGTTGGLLPVFAPDGKSLAFTRVRREKRGRYEAYESASVWIVGLETGERRQLTQWRNGLEQYATSFSPDGSTLLVMRQDNERGGDLETVALRFDGRTSSLLVGEGILPVYSPDGSRIALFRFHGRSEQSDLYVIDADGANLRRLTHTPDRDEFFAGWDPSGERIAYSSFREFEPREAASIMAINADGTCPTEVLSKPRVAFVGPVWQPGPGREAGRIEC
jgi:WD40-like Beta Propeller Repeat